MSDISWLTLGKIVVKNLIRIWTKDENIVTDTCMDIVDWFEGESIDKIRKRKLNRRMEEIVDELTQRYEYIISGADLDDESKNYIKEKLVELFENYTCTFKLFLSLDSSSEKLYKYYIEILEKEKLYLNEKEQNCLFTCLKISVTYITELYRNMPEYNITNIEKIVKKLNNIQDILETVYKQIDLYFDSQSKYKEFEIDYRHHIIEKYNTIRLIGTSGIDECVKRYDLSLAYVKLKLINDVKNNYGYYNGGEYDYEYDYEYDDEYYDEYYDEYDDEYDEDEANGLKRGSQGHLRGPKNPLILITGVAGSGKTTYLQWLAIKSANQNVTMSSNNIDDHFFKGKLPVFIELRSIKWPISLSDIIENFMANQYHSIPDNWIKRNLEQGNFLFLIDGLDEISPEKRESVYVWLDELYKTYNIYAVLTTRPNVKVEWFTDRHSDYLIAPMNFLQIRKFINYWHSAVLEQRGLCSAEEIGKIKERLINKMVLNDTVKDMANNPLLCAMICALHYKNDFLPTNINELYEKCSELLIDSRENVRGIHKDSLYAQLSYDEKKIVLGKISLSMLEQGIASLRTDDISRIIDKLCKVDLEIAKTKKEISILIKEFIDRSGVLREPEEGMIDFIHKTFQEFFAAVEIKRTEKWTIIKKHLQTEHWYETILMSIKYMPPSIAGNIIKEYLRLGDTGLAQYNIMAVMCKQRSIQLPIKLKRKVDEILSSMIPPDTREKKAALYKIGSMSIPFLANQENYTIENQLDCLDVLEVTESKKVFPILETYISENTDIRIIKKITELMFCFSEEDLNESNIKTKLRHYFNKICENNVLECNLETLYFLFVEDDEKGYYPNLKTIDTLILDCTVMNKENEKIRHKRMGGIFKQEEIRKVSCLQLYGSYFEFPYINKFTELKSLCIENSNPDFVGLDKILWKINTANLEELHITSKCEFQFDGNGYKKIYSIKTLSLDFSYGTELRFDGFNKFYNLKELYLRIWYLQDLDFSELDQTTIEKIYIIAEKLPIDFLFMERKKEIVRIDDTVLILNKYQAHDRLMNEETYWYTSFDIDYEGGDNEYENLLEYICELPK